MISDTEGWAVGSSVFLDYTHPVQITGGTPVPPTNSGSGSSAGGAPADKVTPPIAPPSTPVVTSPEKTPDPLVTPAPVPSTVVIPLIMHYHNGEWQVEVGG
jgi:hypothetical protein